ncbi:hypothetical protein [Natranaerobius thermophilus]|uniref:Uncharacterized protein n=1 Tax=Natranaerobius thermophilus (strain ATCC BAA-1301 / DSM 18059 / JW/NM-WN-LF) TaxID=457570 RepID=B2A4L6_NATTJ|nr:hypothetical protein [Natranaerobius thermophilus]ACB85191.1 hypothetical protein Nther_1617 [Natranaerobius thermophilus JW/NM-WN-LF]
MSKAKWELVLLGRLGSRERVIESGLSYNKACKKYNFLKSRINKSGTIIVRKQNNNVV